MNNVRYSVRRIRSNSDGMHKVYYRVAGQERARYRTIAAPTMADAEHILFEEICRAGVREIAEIL